MNGREARAEHNHPRLVALKRDLAQSERAERRMRLLLDRPELTEPHEKLVDPESALRGLAWRIDFFRREIADIESRLFAARVSS